MVVAVGIVGTFVAVVFVDDDTFLVSEGLVAVPASVAFSAQDESTEYSSGEELGDPPPQSLTGRGQGQPCSYR